VLDDICAYYYIYNYLYYNGKVLIKSKDNNESLAVKDHFSNYMDRNVSSLLSTSERNSKIRTGMLNEAQVYAFHEIKFKLFAVFGFIELLRPIYNAGESVLFKKQISKNCKQKA
jgi:hypothetical protein